jgi:hypothetical protein
VVLRGTTRSFRASVQDQIEAAMRRVPRALAAPAAPKWSCATSGATRPP